MSAEINKELIKEELYEGYEDQRLYNQYWDEAEREREKNEYAILRGEKAPEKQKHHLGSGVKYIGG